MKYSSFHVKELHHIQCNRQLLQTKSGIYLTSGNTCL